MILNIREAKEKVNRDAWFLNYGEIPLFDGNVYITFSGSKVTNEWYTVWDKSGIDGKVIFESVSLEECCERFGVMYY